MDFQYNSFIKKHVVFCAEVDQTHLSIQAQISDDGIVEKFLSMRLQPIQWCPGFFYCLGVSNDPSGVVHDPFGYLAPLYHESRIIEDVFVRYADPNGCSYTPLYVYSTSQPEITPNLLLFERPIVQLFCIATGNYYNPTMHNYNFISTEHNIRPGDFCAAQLISYDQPTNTFTVVCETIEEDFRHIPAKFTNGKYEFAIQLEIIRQPAVMFYHPELGAVGFNEKMKVSVPPIKPFACAVITSQPRARTEQNQKQNRLIVTKIVPQLEMLAGYV